MVLFAGICAQVFAAGKKQYVSVMSADLKSDASQFASTVGNARYGEEVSVLQVENAWSKIQLNGGMEGWIPTSALTPKRIMLNLDPRRNTTASASELALGAKGFDFNFESAFEKASGGNFEAVNWVETFSVSQNEAVAFIKEGQLFMGGK